MAHLGEFGAAIKALDPNAPRDTFGYFGEKFEIVDVLPPMLMFQLAAAMTGKIDEQEGMASMWEAYRISLGDDAFNRFYRLAVDRKDTVEDLMRLVMRVYEADAGRPTEQPSVSSDGPSSTSPSTSPSSTVTDSVPPALTRAPVLVGLDSTDDFVPVSKILAG
jgi:hypothetical protein